MSSFDRQTVQKVWRHTAPPLIAALFLSYLDRVNLGFAALTLNRDLGLSNSQFGSAAGAFALGYVLFGIPGTLLVERFGARRWLAIMVAAWGCFSALTAFVANLQELILLRVLLGMAEAGFSPGLVVYCNRWFPARSRARVLGSIFTIVPLSQLVGGALSGGLLQLEGVAGLHGWQWLFLVEGCPTLALATLIFVFLADTPAAASWLTDREKHSLSGQLNSDQPDSEQPAAAPHSGSRARRTGVREVLADLRVWQLAGVAVGLATSGIGALIFLPLIVRSTGFSAASSSLVAAVPGALAAATLPFFGLWSDRTRSPARVVALSCALLSAGLLLSAALLPARTALIPLSIALAAFFGSLAPFWTLPSQFLSGTGAAVAIGFINVSGNLGQFAGPYLLGRLTDLNAGYERGLVCLAVLAGIAAIVMTGQPRNLERVRA